MGRSAHARLNRNGPKCDDVAEGNQHRPLRDRKWEAGVTRPPHFSNVETPIQTTLGICASPSGHAEEQRFGEATNGQRWANLLLAARCRLAESGALKPSRRNEASLA